MENALCIVTIYPIDAEDEMNFNDKNAMIDAVHRTLTEYQTLIEGESGWQTSGFPYIYNNVKEYNGEDEGDGYTLVQIPLK